MKNQIKGTIFLLIAAMVWGASFVFQNEGVDIIHPIAFNGIRTLMGFVALLPLIAFNFLSRRKKGMVKTKDPDEGKNLLKGGILCGIWLCAAGTVQTLGINQGAGESGFITTIYIVFVPILGVFLKHKIPRKVWFAVMMCFIGLYLLCGSFAFNTNQIYLLLGALLFACHILTIDYFSPRVDGVKLSCLQFLVVGIIDCIWMLFVDVPSWNDIWVCMPNLLYAGVASCAIGYTCQIIGQKYVPVAIGSLIMSLESVFSVLSEWVIQGSLLAPMQIFGCAVIFGAVVLVQLPSKSLVQLNLDKA